MTPNTNLSSPPAPDNDDAPVPRASDPRFFWLTAFQYFLIAVVTMVFVVAIVRGLGNLQQLRDMETARGLITFVITLGTVAIAIVLALTAVVVRDFDKRIVVGKEILAVLVGVLGTIVGFYYGASTTKTTAPGGAEAQITVSALEISASQGNATLTGQIEGGTAPYQYTISFPGSTILKFDATSADGSVQSGFKLPEPAPAELSVTIEGKDKNGVAFSHNKDGSIKTTIPK